MGSMKDKRVAVLMGGRSAEREVSLWSGAAVLEALRERGFDAVGIDVDLEVAARLREERVELAFIALHGRFGEDGCIQGLLESLAIPYTGSGVLASALAMDKIASKRIFVSNEIDTPAYVAFRNEEVPGVSVENLPFPLPVVVKPGAEGSSVGVKIVSEAKDLAPACEEAASFQGGVLVERYHEGREIHVAVLDDVALGSIEVVPESGFYDYEAKYLSGAATQYLCPAPLSPALRERVEATALATHRALGCAGATRTDMIVGEDGIPLVLEINTLPGMTRSSLLPKIAQSAGISFGELCERILRGASLKA